MLNTFATLPTGGTYFSFLKRLSDGLFYDDDDQTFKAFGALVGRLDFVEDVNVSGQFSWSREIPDGDYVIYSVVEEVGPTLNNIADAAFVRIRQGQEQTLSITDIGMSLDVLEAEIEDC